MTSIMIPIVRETVMRVSEARVTTRNLLKLIQLHDFIRKWFGISNMNLHRTANS